MSTYVCRRDREWLSDISALRDEGNLSLLVATDRSTFDHLLTVTLRLLDENEELYRLIAQLADHTARPGVVDDSPDFEGPAFPSGSGHLREVES